MSKAFIASVSLNVIAFGFIIATRSSNSVPQPAEQQVAATKDTGSSISAVAQAVRPADEGREGGGTISLVFHGIR
ncbi:MAG: hypothetical protein CMO80_19975 [Verrucomicrobiales bacterium]|nr:hypothetical protein [Verrucomicrobiales bacterium]